MLLKAEAERTEQDTEECDKRMAQLKRAVEQDSGAIEEYDEVMARQLISSIKVISRETILVRFKDGVEIEQRIGKARDEKTV
jgi:primosomal protein N''